MSTTAQTAPALTIGKIIDEMYALKAEKKELESSIKDIKSDIDLLESQLLHRLEEEDTDTSAGKQATARRTELVLPVIEDWDAFEAYIKETDSLYLLGKRVLATGFRELLQQGEEVPGLRPYTKVSISLRKKS
jgi:hypothetical protein